MVDISKLYYVNVGPKGTFQASGKYATKPEDVDTLIAHLRATSIDHVAIHLHGGLVDEEAGMCIAEKMIDVYEKAGAHPVSIVWETGLLDTLRDNLGTIHKTKLFAKLLKFVRDFVAERLGVSVVEGLEAVAAEPDLSRPARELEQDPYFKDLEGVAPPDVGLEGLESAPESDEAAVAEVEGWLKADPEMRDIVASEAGLDVVRTETILPSDDGLEGIFSWVVVARSIVRIGKRVLSRFLRRRDHGAYCTIVEEILREVYLADLGQWTWGKMKDKSHEMFKSNEGLSGLDQHGARYLVDALAALQGERPQLVVDVVGHSAGSIATCHLLDAMAGTLKVRKIGFLAPAVRTELAHSALFSQPERCDTYRMFTMTDAYEVDDELVKVIYPRSLLYFVSGVLEPTEADETLLGLARHVTGAAPYDEDHLKVIVDYLNADRTRVVYAVTSDTALEGLRSTSESHGGFDDDPETRKSLTHYLRN